MLENESVLNNVFIQAMRDAGRNHAALRAHTESRADGKVRVTYFVAQTGNIPYE